MNPSSSRSIPLSSRRFTGRALLVLPILFVVGCVTPVSFRGWQESVEEYIATQANGDPAALRDVSWDNRHPGFAVMSQPVAEESADVKGLLLGHEQIGANRWFVFLVAEIQKGKIESTRVAALASQEGKVQWRTAAPNPQSTQLYAASPPDDPHSPFPRATDQFDLSTDGAQITVTHRPSGARWTLSL